MLQYRNLIFSILGGLALGLAWHFPGNLSSAIFTTLAITALLLPFLNSPHSYRHSFLYGFIAHALACYWIIDTIKTFGGYSLTASSGLFLAYVILHALQFPVFIFFARILQRTSVKKMSLTLPLAWLAASFSCFTLFPWDYSQTLLAFYPLSQIADLGGTYLISFLLFFLAEAVLDYLRTNAKRNLTIAATIFILALSYGTFQYYYYTNLPAKTLKASLIQADLSVSEKGNVRFLSANLDKYIRLSEEAAESENPQLIIWPESIIADPIAEPLEGRNLPKRFSFIQDKSSFIFGALTYAGENLHNSAIATDPAGEIQGVYHKQILMPFGEFMPLADKFPELLELNPNVGNFKAGSEITVMNLGDNIKAATLICYEDLIPELSVSASNNGANLLVNLTNDAWFGKSAAAIQHNLIASFRAIETRRYLLRSTNSGLTSIIDWTGKTLKTAPVFGEAILTADFKLNDKSTIYSRIGGNSLWRILAYLTIIFSIISWFKLRTTK